MADNERKKIKETIKDIDSVCTATEDDNYIVVESGKIKFSIHKPNNLIPLYPGDEPIGWTSANIGEEQKSIK